MSIKTSAAVRNSYNVMIKYSKGRGVYRVASCEEEAVFAESQEKLCREILDRLHIESSITVFHGNEDFLTVFRDEGQRYELLLLDIIMEGKDGIELAKTIREMDRAAAIIFTTSSRDLSLQGCDVKTDEAGG